MTQRIETAEEFNTWEQEGISQALIQIDGQPGPALFWMTEDGDWLGIRPISEDDGPFYDMDEATRDTYAVPVNSPAPDGYGDEESFTPLTVLWSE